MGERRNWSDGRAYLLLSLLEPLEKLVALVPPPWLYLLHYHGVLTPRARDRERIMPSKPVESHRLRTALRAFRPAAINWVGGPARPRVFLRH